MGFFDFLKPNPAKKLLESLAEESGVMQRCPVCHALTFRDSGLRNLDRAVKGFESRLARREEGAMKLGDSRAFQAAIKKLCDETGPLCDCEEAG